MRISFIKKKLDTVDIVSALLMSLAAVFVSTFFLNAAAGARGSEESYLARLRQAVKLSSAMKT